MDVTSDKGAEWRREQEKQNMEHFVNRKSRTDGKRLGWMFALPLALAAAMHGLIHLMYVTSTGPEVELGFGGSSWVPGDGATALVTGLVAITIAGNCMAALGLLRMPVLKSNVVLFAIVGNIASLAAFAVMLPGLVPNAEAHVYGMITSLVLIVGAFHHELLSNAVGRALPEALAKRMGARI